MSTDTVSSYIMYFQSPSEDSKAWCKINADPKSVEQHCNFSEEGRKVEIENVRSHEDEYNLDTAGFLFKKHVSGFKDFDNQEAIKKGYYKESIDLIKQVTGADRVVVFGYTIRDNHPGIFDVSGIMQAPLFLAHIDHSPESARKLVHMHIPENVAPVLLKHRFQIINLWRPINHPAIDHPLAVCDFRSIDWDKDLVPTTVMLGDTISEGISVRYNSQHKWKYQRGMTPDETILFKCYDSKMDGQTAVFAPHAAFTDPTTPEAAPPRQSIELNLLVL